jgi:DNA-binding NarL/FixJ family response regulator
MSTRARRIHLSFDPNDAAAAIRALERAGFVVPADRHATSLRVERRPASNGSGRRRGAVPDRDLRDDRNSFLWLLGRGSAKRSATGIDALTPRERTVLLKIALGANAEAIAQEHVVSIATVRTQIRSILQKLGVRSQVAAVAALHETARRARTNSQ